MAENPTTSPQKPIPDTNPTTQNPNLPSTPIPPSPSHSQISSPRLPQQQPMHQFQQLQQLQQHHQQQQQQQNMIAASPSASTSSGGFQIQQQQNMQRSGSVGQITRMTQMQQQFGTTAANAMRQHNGMYGGQVNFAAASNMQQHMGMSRAGLMGQGVGGQMPMLSGQATASQFTIQPQMLGQARQKAGLVQASQYHTANASGQALHGMQTIGMSNNSLAMNSQIRANEVLPYAAQRMSQGQIRQQQLSQTQLLSSPKLSAQVMARTSSLASMNSQLSGFTQNGQTAMVHNPQEWLRQTPLALAGSGHSTFQLQQQRQQAFLQQQLQKNVPLDQLQVCQFIPQQPSNLNAQQLQTQTSLAQQQQQMHLQQQQQQQQSPQIPASTNQKTISLTGSQPDTSGGSSSQGDLNNQLIGKRKIQDLVSQVDPQGKLDPEVEDLLLEFADEFIESATTFACSLAKHRKSSVLESKDMLLHLEKNFHMDIPGYARDEQRLQRKMIPSETHAKRIKLIRSLLESSQLETDAGNTRKVIHDAVTDSAIKPSPSPEQLLCPPAGPAILQKVPRC